MRERELVSIGSIDVSKLEKMLQTANVSDRNCKIIMDAANSESFEKALVKLDSLKQEGKNIWSYYFMNEKNSFLKEGTFQFLYKIMKCLIGEQEAIQRVTGYGSLTSKMLEQLDVEDAVKVSLKQLNWAIVNGFPKETEYAMEYFLSLDKKTAVSVIKDVFGDGSYSYHTIISLICIYINRQDVASEFNFVDKLHEYLRMYADMSGVGARKMILEFDYKTQEASDEQIEKLNKMINSKNDRIYHAMGLVALTCFNKSELLEKFSAIYLANMQKVTGYLCENANEETFKLLNVDMDEFIKFIWSFKNKENFLIQSNNKFVSKFTEDSSLDKNCILTYISKLSYTKKFLDFITGKCDLSEIDIPLDTSQKYEISHLERVFLVYKALFGDSEECTRIKFVIDLHNTYYNIDLEVVEKLKEYNVNDFTLSRLMSIFANGDIINEFNKAALAGKPHKKIETMISLFKGKEDLINSLLKDYKTRSLEQRFLLVLIIGDNLDTHKSAFDKITESSKAIQSAIAQVYKNNPYLAEAELLKLKDKKPAARKAAFNTLKSAYGSKYNEQINEAMEIETNDKLKLEMQDHLNTIDNIDDENNINITKVVETLVKNRKKVEFAYKDMPVVHDVNGNEASEDYLVACMVAYANEPVAGVSYLGALLSKQLNQNEFAKFAEQAFYNFMDDGAEAKKKWAIYFSSIHGGFAMVDILKSQIGKWAENSRGAIAGEATKALALNPAPIALLTVDGMSRKYKFKQVKNAAGDAMGFAAEQLKITKEELSDRIVPNLGFDESMKIVFNYGERSFDVYLNTALELEVIDNSKGKKIKSLPAVGKTDDQEIATESLKQFKELKKQLKATVSTQRDRLDMALSDGRKWTKEAYENLFVKNPIMHNFAIGLVWGIYEDNKIIETFRYMEDGSFNSSEEDEVELTDDMIIGIVHPLEMEEELLSTWREQLSDYEVIQPLVQLEREIYAPSEDELKGKEAISLAGKVLSPATLSNKMLAQGWNRGDIMDAGFFECFVKFNESLQVGAQLQFTGCSVGYYEEGNCTVKQIRFFNAQNNEKGDWGRDKEEHFLNISEVNPKFFSEILLQVAKACSTSGETNPNWREATGY